MEIHLQHKQLDLGLNLDFAGAVIHHAVLGSHGSATMQFGGVEGDLLNVGDSTDGVGLTWACGLILVQPVKEELLKHGGFTPCWHDLDLHKSQTPRQVR